MARAKFPKAGTRFGPEPLWFHLSLFEGDKQLTEKISCEGFLKGVKRWHEHSWCRDDAFQNLGRTRIELEHGTSLILPHSSPSSASSAGNDGPVMLLIPSLINNWTILDLHPKLSFFQFLADNNVRPAIFDWGDSLPPMDAEEMVKQLLLTAAHKLMELHNSKNLSLLGYCMGGVFALGLAQALKERASALCLLATPWDFHQGYDWQALEQLFGICEPVLAAEKHLPRAWLDLIFASQNPGAVVAKFQQFGINKNLRQLPEELFIATEDWLSSGAQLDEKIIRQVFRQWVVDNALTHPLPNLEPEKVQCKAIVVIPKKDQIVSYKSAAALAGKLRNPTTLETDGGHISLMVSETKAKDIWKKLLAELA